MIQDAIIDDDWKVYLNNSISLTAEEIFTVKIWFKNITEVRDFTERQSTTDTQNKLQSAIRQIMNDPDLLAVREKLIAATNQPKEPNT